MTQRQKQNMPALRFPEFSGEWFEERLGNIAELTSSKRVYLTDYVKQGIPFYRGKEISELRLGIEPSDILFISEERFEDYKDKYGVPQVGDILITAVGTLGNVLQIRNIDKFYFKDGNLIWLRKINQNSDYLEVLLQRNTRDLIKTSIGSTQKALTMVELRKLIFTFPPLPEQQKIASFLSSVDRKIEQLGKKKALLEQYKKGMMQKLFSQELRFADSDGNSFPDWEKTTLGNVVSNVGGTALEKFMGQSGTHKVISIGNYGKEGRYYDNGNRIVLNAKTATKLLNKDDLVMVLNDKTSLGDIIGSTILIDSGDSYIYNQRSERIICNDTVQPIFMWQLLNSKKFRSEVFKLSQGGTQIYVNFPTVKSIRVHIPTIPEQQKIANFLSSIDQKIDLVTTELDHAKSFKKGLLQQMFI